MDLPYLLDMLADCVDNSRDLELITESDAAIAHAWLVKQAEAFDQLQPVVI